MVEVDPGHDGVFPCRSWSPHRSRPSGPLDRHSGRWSVARLDLADVEAPTATADLRLGRSYPVNLAGRYLGTPQVRKAAVVVLGVALIVSVTLVAYFYLLNTTTTTVQRSTSGSTR
jgi:hypothetical protein